MIRPLLRRNPHEIIPNTQQNLSFSVIFSSFFANCIDPRKSCHLYSFLKPSGPPPSCADGWAYVATSAYGAGLARCVRGSVAAPCVKRPRRLHMKSSLKFDEGPQFAVIFEMRGEQKSSGENFSLLLIVALAVFRKMCSFVLTLTITRQTHRTIRAGRASNPFISRHPRRPAAEHFAARLWRAKATARSVALRQRRNSVTPRCSVTYTAEMVVSSDCCRKRDSICPAVPLSRFVMSPRSA